MTTQTAPSRDPHPNTAFEITVMVKYESDGSRTITHTPPRKVNALALPSLPLPVPGLPIRRPSYRLEVVELVGANEELRYCRPYARPGQSEAYGPDSGWTRIPVRHTQVLVTLIPAYSDPGKRRLKAYEPTSSTPWLNIELPLA